LISAAIREDMPALERSRAHRRAADLLGADGAPIEAIAVHLLACRPAGDRETAEILRAAAEQATGRGEHQAARRFLARALAEPPPAETRLEVEIELALVAAATGAPDAVGRVVASLEELKDPRRRARTLQALARLLFARSDFAAASEAAARAIGELNDSDPLARELLIDELAISLVHHDQHPQAAARLAAVLQAARQKPAEPALRAMLAGSAVQRGEPAARVSELAGAALDGGAGQDAFYGLGTGIAVMALIYVDALDLAAPPIDAALERARRVGSLIGVGFASHWRAQLHYHQGALADAIADANQTLEVCRSGWDVCLPWVAPILAGAYVDGGDLDAAAAALELCENLDQQRIEHAFALAARAHLALARADPAAALADLETAGALAERHGITQPTMLPWRSQAALASLQLGDQHRAAKLAAHELTQARKIGARRTLGIALRVAGLTTPGHRGLELLTEAVAILERSPAALQRAQALADLGAAQRRAGHRTAARQPLQRALQLANQLGATPLATTAADELHAAGGRRRAARHDTGPTALTATERRVAQLAAQGLGTPQIAHTLYVTPKTIEWHLGHIYQKLKINSRHQLAAALSNAMS
jgi:DNA-binding CsgD family transcriptional regulator